MEDDRISLAHGNGGRFMRELIEEIFARHLGKDELDTQADAVPIALNGGDVLITTDGFKFYAPNIRRGFGLGCVLAQVSKKIKRNRVVRVGTKLGASVIACYRPSVPPLPVLCCARSRLAGHERGQMRNAATWRVACPKGECEQHGRLDAVNVTRGR